MDDNLETMIEQGDWNAVQDFLQVNYQTMNLRSGNILQRAAEHALDIRRFIRYFPIDMIDEHGRTAVWWAAFRGQLGNLRALLEAGANPNLADHHGVAPLFVAANGMTVSLLHDFGAQLQAFDHEGTPLLEYVEKSGRQDAADRIRELSRGSSSAAGPTTTISSRRTGTATGVLEQEATAKEDGAFAVRWKMGLRLIQK